MASESQKVPTYPVWVGNLKETVRDKDLKRVFSKHGQVASCKVMQDAGGNSRGFGFVNFYTELEAERAASAKQGFKISGSSIKTKGPNQLKMEGHFTVSPPKPEGHSLDYRPLTDCSYFVAGNACTKGVNCPYRHSETARSSTLTCRQWKERNCLDLTCPYRHPGGKEKKTDLTPGSEEIVTSSVFELLKCGGRCGNASCAAHFASKEDLSQHVKMARLLQCRHCRAIFFNDVEFRDHKRSCRSRMNSGSTDVSSDSLDIEELPNSDSTDSELDEDDPTNQFSGRSSSSKMSKPYSKSSDIFHKSASANVLHVTPPKKRSRDRRSSESGTKGKREPALSKLSLPPKPHKSQFDSKKALNFGSNTEDHLGRVMYPDMDRSEQAYYDGGVVEYSSTSDSDDSDEDEGDDDYPPSEMARLLSLNDQDMYEGEEEGRGEKEETEARGGYGRETLGWSEEITMESRKEHKTNGATAQEGEVKSSLAGAVKSPQRVKLEPVGVFWDIENCQVPPNKSAFALAAKMRRFFFEGKREAEFMCVCDVTKERKEVIEALNKAQVTLVHINAIAKNAADDKLRQSLRRFAHTYPAPSTVVLISGDINFSSELTDLRHIHNITIVLVHNPVASEGLKVFAHTLINFDEFIQDVEPPHKPPQNYNVQRVVIVSGLPRHVDASKLSARLSRISDNCGGKVLKIDTKSGTAKILFWTTELATKALKRMAGEDVFGSKISTSLEAPPSSRNQNQSSEQIRHLSGPALSKTFPPPPQPQPSHYPPAFSSPRPQRPPPVQPPQYFPPPHHFGPHPARMPGPPLLSPPHQGGGGRFPLIRPGVPPGYPYGPSPSRPPVPVPLHSAPPSQIRGPQGKVLIFRIPVLPGGSLEQLNGQVVGVRLEACVKAEHVILWHNFNELQVLLRVDMLQTASAMKEDMIRTLCEKKQLRKELADAFLERCAESIHRVSKAQQLPWEVNVCGWTLDEEEERVVRSQVVALLRQCTPSYWTKWDTFKRKYYEMYSSAISEMAIHNACRGAVQILGNPGNSQHQVIIFYELSPLLKVVNNPSLHRQLQKSFIKLLNAQPWKKIKLLDFVRIYRESDFGQSSLPMSFSGKLLQELISTTPNVTMVGTRPSSIYVTLGDKDLGPAASTPQNLAGISAAFVNLLVHQSSGEIPLSHFQQEYQTFYHKSIRVSDYISGSSKLRDLLDLCSGIKLKDVPQASGGVHTMVCLDNNTPSADNVANRTRSSSSSSSAGPVAPSAAPADIAALSSNFRSLLSRFTNNRLSLSQFQQEYQTYYRHSFRVSDYLNREDAGLKDLLQFCDGIKVVNIQHPNGRSQAFVCRSEDVDQPPPPKPSPTKMHKSPSGASVGSGPPPSTAEVRVSPVADSIPAESVQLFKKECIEVLSSIPDRKVLLSKFPEAYYKCKGQIFALSRYKAKKIVLLVQAIPDVMLISGEKDAKVIELITDTQQDFEHRVEKMLYSLPNCSVTLDRFVSEYEKHSGLKLSNFYGHSRLLKLLEDIPDTVTLKGNGASRPVLLHPRRVFALDMAKLVALNPGLLISNVVPAYKEKFGKELIVTNLGYPKLIRALESIPNVLEIRGEGASRKIFPKHGPPSGMVAQPQTVSLPPLQLLADEVIALLMTTFSAKLSLIQLTQKYNTCFRPDLPQVSKEQLLEAIKKLPNFKITGSGTTIYVQNADRSLSGTSTTKRKSKTSESKDEKQSEPPKPQVDTKPPDPAGIATTSADVNTSAPLPADMSPVNMRKGGSNEATHPTTPVLSPAEVDRHTSTSAEPSLVTQPKVLTQSPVNTQQSSPCKPIVMAGHKTTAVAQSAMAVVAGAASDTQPHALTEDSESQEKRLFSETRRLLQLHTEHAMTLAELVEKFKEVDEPSQPSSEKLYHLLNKFNVKEVSHGSKKPTKVLQISYIPSSVGDTVIQLGVPDCFWKLSMDLAYLFVFHPTPKFSMSVADLESAYAECYGRKLLPAIYAASTVEKLFTWKQVVQVIQFNSSSGMCHLTPSSSLHALATLLAELLFTRGGNCTSPEDLLDLYQQHFGVPLLLSHFGVDNVLSLLELPKLKEVVKLVHVQVEWDAYQVKPILTSSSLLAEQLRHLLTIHNDRVPIDEVESLYTTTFGIQTHINIANLLERKKIIQTAPHVVNVISNNKWMVWASTGRPYPSRGKKTSPSLASSKESTTLEVGTTSAEDDKEVINQEAALAKGNAYSDAKPPATSQPKLQQRVHIQSESDQGTSAYDMVSAGPSEPDKDVKTVKMVALSEKVSTASVDKDIPLSGYTDVSPTMPLTTGLSPPLHKKDLGDVSAETYGFLEKTLEPELMAELRASGELHKEREQTLRELLNTRPLSDKAIQLLIHFAKPMNEIDLEADNSDSGGEQGAQAKENQPQEPIDYLQSGMTPDQVLEEMRKLKEHSGGYLSPEKMEPFLTYFGELSSRELDRIESLEEAEKNKQKTGAAKKKRVMAIRFPGKSPAISPHSDNDPYKEQRLYSAELLKDKLPKAPDFENVSDSSDSDGSCPRPLEREEYIQTLLKRGIPSITEAEVMRATQAVDKEAQKNTAQLAAGSSKLDWPLFETESEAKVISDFPKPLIPLPQEGNTASVVHVFDDSKLVLDADSSCNASEWPYLI